MPYLSTDAIKTVQSIQQRTLLSSKVWSDVINNRWFS